MSQLLDWARMSNVQRSETLDLWIRQRTPLPGIEALLNAPEGTVTKFVQQHLPHLQIELRAHCVKPQEWLVKRRGFCKADDYPEVGFKTGFWIRRRV